MEKVSHQTRKSIKRQPTAAEATEWIPKLERSNGRFLAAYHRIGNVQPTEKSASQKRARAKERLVECLRLNYETGIKTNTSKASGGTNVIANGESFLDSGLHL